MTPDLVFPAANSAALAGWLVLILIPRRFTRITGLPRTAIPLALSVLYTGLILTYFGAGAGGYGSISEVRQLFASDEVLLAGWTHYLAFDLLVGALMADRMDRAGVHRLIHAPILVSIFMFGPLGFLLAFLTEAGLRHAPRFPLKGIVQ